ncbi:response regulator transcription factor [Kroppenstedtia guangzhouensis]|jgi:DNA-binding response OmpR family regulator|uniref:response regulator transcription factor n=1 Tax=Kroppenstedtia guangzhouensis TaxID=1274356 RepID=UPI00227D5229|nr:response regulator transcription factor [Kroppenstedtia guangzhouensis]
MDLSHILLVEDEERLGQLISEQLHLEGHRVSVASDGEEGYRMWMQEQPDLVILDWMLPRMDGVEVCRKIRETSIVPVMMLTARGDEMEKVWGLEVGADDYMTKPFSTRELKARVRALLRRAAFGKERSESTCEDGVLSFPFMQLDRERREVKLEEQLLVLTPKEYELLELFLSYPGRVFSRAYLMDRIWRADYLENDRTVDTQISRLRKKMGIYGKTIETVWGTGYKFNPGKGSEA